MDVSSGIAEWQAVGNGSPAVGQTLKQRILEAAKADSIPEGQSGLWTIKKLQIAKPYRRFTGDGFEDIPDGNYTNLWCYTNAKAMESPDGECVMNDFPKELNKHLEFMLKAHGNVLVTGLGLGCVVRGLLANPAVKRVTVIERSASVLKLVWPHMLDDRIEMIRANAVRWTKRTRRKFDAAWTDLWNNPDETETHLQVTHMEVIANLSGKVGFQGAWEFPRDFRRRMANLNVI